MKEHIAAKLNNETMKKCSVIGHDTTHAFLRRILNAHDICYDSHIILALSDYTYRQLGSAAMLGPVSTSISTESYYWKVDSVLTVYKGTKNYAKFVLIHTTKKEKVSVKLFSVTVTLDKNCD